MCTKVQAVRYLEKWPSFDMLKAENDHFSRCLLGFLSPDFHILSDLGRYCPRVSFRVVDEKLIYRHVSHHPYPEFLV